MLFSGYTDFRSTVMAKLRRNDLDLELGRFVLLAEKEMFRVLRHPEMVTTATISLVDGVGSLPADFLEMEDLWNAAGCRVDGEARTMNRKPNDTGRYYSIKGSNIYVGSLTGDLVADYFAAAATIAATATATNWVLQKYPNIYYYGVLKQAYDFLEDTEKLDRATVNFKAAMHDAKIDGDRKLYGDAEIRPRSNNP